MGMTTKHLWEFGKWIALLLPLFIASTALSATTNSTTFQATVAMPSGAETVNSTLFQHITEISPAVAVNLSSQNFSAALGFLAAAGETIPPTITNVSANATTVTTNNIVRFNASCADTIGLASFIFSHNNSEAFTNEAAVAISGKQSEINYTLQIALADPSALGWLFYCSDVFGNTAVTATQVLIIGNNPPSAPTIIFPQEGDTLNFLDINVSATDAEADGLTYFYYINDSLNESVAGNYTIVDIGDGSYSIKVDAYDSFVHGANSSAITVVIDRALPNVTLASPMNSSGDNDGNINFTFIPYDATTLSNCSLFIDGSLRHNKTYLSKDVMQNLSASSLSTGKHNWSVSCIDSAGNTGHSKNRTFTVIPTGDFDGLTTDFSTVDVTNVTQLIIENTSAGRIVYQEEFDLSDGINISALVNISFNAIAIDSNTSYPLNNSADLYLYGLTFSNPLPLRNGAFCPACTELSYSGGIFRFNVTGFTTYSSEETPVSSPGGSSGGGGGGGGGAGITTTTSLFEQSFRVEPYEITKRLVIGESAKGAITITNTGTAAITLSITTEGLDDYLSLSHHFINLPKGETKTITLNMVGSRFGAHGGKVTISGQSQKIEIPIALEVVTATALFDVQLDIPALFKELLASELLRVQISLINVLGGEVDALVYYFIKDLQGNVLYEESEAFAIEDQRSYVKEFELPDGIPQGKYLAAIEVRYANSYAVSSELFEVVPSKDVIGRHEGRIKLLSIFIILLIGAVLYAYLITRLFMGGRKDA